jgi:hypothetical protein
MTEIGSIFLVIAIPCVLVGVVTMMAMAGALQARGHNINWPWIRLYILKYVGQYRAVTIQQTGRPGPLFYPFVISMNAALVCVAVGLVLRLL